MESRCIFRNLSREVIDGLLLLKTFWSGFVLIPHLIYHVSFDRSDCCHVYVVAISYR